MSRRCVALIVITQLLVGCSLLTMQKPQATRERDPDCVVSLAPPIADGLIATTIAYSLVSAELNPQTRNQATVTVDIGVTAIALAFVGSGAFGLHRRSLCRSAYEDHSRYLAETAPAETSAPRAPAPPPRSPAARMTGLTLLVIVGGSLVLAGLAAAISSHD